MQPTLFDLGPDPEATPGAPASPAASAAAPIEFDRTERDLASDPAHHVVLEASAGTGKTKVLVDRYVNLIERGVDPRNILAITFTRKAAAEMRDRVLKEIHERAAHRESFAARWAGLKDRIADVSISTIDAFCFGLLREFPLEADVDPGFEIADETEVPRFRAEAIELTLRACRETLLGEESVRLLMAFKSTSQFRAALDRLLDARHVALASVREFVRRQAHVESLAQAGGTFIARLQSFLQRTPDLTDLIDRGPVQSVRFQRLARDLAAVLTGAFHAGDLAEVRRLQREVQFYFTREGEARKQSAQIFKDAFASPKDRTAHYAALKAIAPDVSGALEELERGVNAVLARGVLLVLEEAIRQFDRLMAEHAVLDFPAMLDRAVRLLERQGDFARSRLKLDARYHHLLVDEFQDTSEAQWRLIELLTRTWGEGEGLNAVIPPTIFIVGDRKQSIYRFRHAEVTLMDVAAAFIETMRPDRRVRHAIQQSFRAVPELQGFVNALAREIRSGETIAERFEYRDIDEFPGISLAPGALRDGRPVLGLAAGTSIPETANIVATEIKRLLDEQTIVRDRAGARPIRPDDIAVLFRGRAAHRYYEEALEARGVKTYVYKGLGFFDAPEVLDLHVLLRYLAEPDSNIRAAAFLRSRFVRVSDAALVALAPDFAGVLRAPTLAIEPLGLAPIDAALLCRARAGVAAWLDEVDRVPPAGLVDRILSETAYAHELRGARYAQARENVKKVRALIRRVQNRGYATFGRLADYFKRLAAGEEANAIVAARGCVQLMTVHSAKGLEFPVVFLVRMNAGAGGVNPPIVVVPKDEHGAPDVAISMSAPSRHVERAREAEESRRLFYVAITRAKDRLYLSAEFPEGKWPMSGSFAKLLPASMLSAMQQGVPARGAETSTWQAAGGETFTFDVCRPDPHPPEASTDALDTPGAIDDGEIRDVDVPRISVTTDQAAAGASSAQPSGRATDASPSDRRLGALVHRLFQHDVNVADIADVIAWAESLVPPADVAGDVAGGAREDDATLARRAAEMYVAMRQREDVAEVLASGVVQHEVPFSLRLASPDRVVRGQIDAVVVPADGPIVVVEFKTGAPDPAHGAQVEIYRRALGAAWPGRTVEARLFYF